jgi:hypothetical protein
MTMAKKRKTGNLTAEDHARFEETSRMVQERIAYHEAKAREDDQKEQARRQSGG